MRMWFNATLNCMYNYFILIYFIDLENILHSANVCIVVVVAAVICVVPCTTLFVRNENNNKIVLRCNSICTTFYLWTRNECVVWCRRCSSHISHATAVRR